MPLRGNALWRSRILIAVMLCVGTQSIVAGQSITFEEVSSDRGIISYAPLPGFCVGLAAADYDDDGDIDLFVPQDCDVADALYRNLGDGTYEEIAASVGLASTLPSRAALWFDYDGDHDLDLLVLRDQFGSFCEANMLTLYRQEVNGSFTDVTAAAGLVLPPAETGQQVGGMCAGDVVGDSSLDLCVAVWDGDTRLFENNSDGTFTDVSIASGLSSSHPKPWQPVMFDADGDGLQDIFIAMDVDENHLWINQGDGTFVDAAVAAGVHYAGNEMGVTVGDVDNDGLLDLYITNINVPSIQTNTLFRNTSSPDLPSFEDISGDWNVDTGGWGWGTTSFDADRDGLLDLAATNGRAGDDFGTDPSVFFHNQGGSFSEVASQVNFDDTFIASCLISFDSDRDGDIDVAQSCHHGALRLLENQPIASRGASPNWITIVPRQGNANHFAIGAIVRATAGETTMTRMIHAGCSTLGQEPAEAHFGLGSATIIDQITIEWPDGDITTIADVAPNQVLTINNSAPTPPCAGDADGDSDVDLSDLLDVLSNWGTDGSVGGDSNGDGAVNLSDLLEVLSNWGSTCE